jgi:putative transposase
MRCTWRRPQFYRRASCNITLDTETVDPTPAHPRRKPAWATQEVLRLKVLMGRAGSRQIATTFNRLHQAHASHACTVGKTFVADCIKVNQYALAQLRRDMRSQLPRPVPVNAVWAMDMTFYTDASGAQHGALGMLDHGSRLVLCLQTLLQRNSWAMLGHLCFAIAKYGKPRKLRTDNERVFTSFVFTTFLKLAGIRHQRTQTCAPWQNGRMERLFGTLKPLLRQLVIPTKAALQLALDEFTLFYNHARPHQNLGGLTPAEKWCRYSKADLAQRPPKPAVLVQALDGLLVGYWMRR